MSLVLVDAEEDYRMSLVDDDDEENREIGVQEEEDQQISVDADDNAERGATLNSFQLSNGSEEAFSLDLDLLNRIVEEFPRLEARVTMLEMENCDMRMEIRQLNERLKVVEAKASINDEDGNGVEAKEAGSTNPAPNKDLLNMHEPNQVENMQTLTLTRDEIGPDSDDNDGIKITLPQNGRSTPETNPGSPVSLSSAVDDSSRSIHSLHDSKNENATSNADRNEVAVTGEGMSSEINAALLLKENKDEQGIVSSVVDSASVIGYPVPLSEEVPTASNPIVVENPVQIMIQGSSGEKSTLPIAKTKSDAPETLKEGKKKNANLSQILKVKIDIKNPKPQKKTESSRITTTTTVAISETDPGSSVSASSSAENLECKDNREEPFSFSVSPSASPKGKLPQTDVPSFGCDQNVESGSRVGNPKRGKSGEEQENSEGSTDSSTTVLDMTTPPINNMNLNSDFHIVTAEEEIFLEPGYSHSSESQKVLCDDRMGYNSQEDDLVDLSSYEGVEIMEVEDDAVYLGLPDVDKPEVQVVPAALITPSSSGSATPHNDMKLEASSVNIGGCSFQVVEKYTTVKLKRIHKGVHKGIGLVSSEEDSTENRKNVWLCDCGSKFKREKYLKEHLEVSKKEGKNIKCYLEGCNDKDFASMITLRNHLKKQHKFGNIEIDAYLKDHPEIVWKS